MVEGVGRGGMLKNPESDWDSFEILRGAPGTRIEAVSKRMWSTSKNHRESRRIYGTVAAGYQLELLESS